ncbi:MAG: O-antigen ligase family protein [Alphaproteobacteria bacterium]|nr:O-antigen ligase family protein [Alphaproteobacteria bacterium]
MLLVASWRLRGGLPGRAAGWALIILAAGVAVMVAQIVPLPKQIWAYLPSRTFLTKDFASIGLDPNWMPLSLSPFESRQAIIAILPGVASFFAIISVPHKRWDWVVAGIIVLAIVGALVALAQTFQGPNGIFNFFEEQGQVTASGFFANRNFLAAQLYVAVPFAIVLTFCRLPERSMSRIVWGFLGLLTVLVLVAGVGASGSRMGAILVVAALLCSLVVYLTSQSRWSQPGLKRSGFFIAVLFVGGVVVAQLCFVALLRFSQTDLSTDYRGVMHATSWKAALAFLPFGSGFGSFVPAYQLFENPDSLIAAYVNHAHSDWLELVLEGGFPIVIVLAGFCVWLATRMLLIWRDKDANPYAKAASVAVMMLLIHSYQDYPLRAPALLAMFGLCLGMMAVQTGRSKTQPTVGTQNFLEGDVVFKSRPGGFSGVRKS